MQINKKRLVQTFCEMVSIDSESYHEKKMKDYLMNIFKECHMECIEMPIEGFEAGNIHAVFKEEAIKEHASIEYDDYVHIEAYKINEDEEVVERFKHAFHNLQLTPRLISTHGGSDNNRYVKEGIRGIAVACAMNDCHSVSEYTTIDELEKSALLALHLMID